MNLEKENERDYYNVNLTNKGNKNYTELDSHYKEFITVFISLYQRMKKLSYTLSCIKQDVYTFLFYFIHLSCS